MHTSILLTQISLSTASLLSGYQADISSSISGNGCLTSQLNNPACSVLQHEDFQDPLHVFNDSEAIHQSPKEQLSPSNSSVYSPWNKKAITCTTNAPNKFCTYHAPGFANHRGLSLITKPEIADEIAAYQSLITPATETPERAYPSPFEIKELPGRGLGVIANRTIERGERLFAHTILGIFHNEAFFERKAALYHEHESLFHDAIDQLPKPSNEKFWELAAHEDGLDGVIGRLNTNVFAATFGGEDHSVVVPETARMNHDCRPNAMYYLDPESLVHYTHAARTIQRGEEITITYVDPLQTYKDRQAAIKSSWGFQCTCSLCTMPSIFREESDIRIKHILQLNKEFDDISSYSQAITNMIPKAEFLVSLYEQEKLYGAMEEPYRIAALSFAKAGKVWEAAKWAMKATEAYLITDGGRERMTDDLEGMSELAKL